MDASLSDKLIALDPEANAEKVKVIKAEVIGSSDWNPQMTAKTMNCGESICHWLSAICNFVEKKEVSFFSVNNFRWFFLEMGMNNRIIEYSNFEACSNILRIIFS